MTITTSQERARQTSSYPTQPTKVTDHQAGKQGKKPPAGAESKVLKDHRENFNYSRQGLRKVHGQAGHPCWLSHIVQI